MRAWTTPEEDYLREHYLACTQPELAAALGRPIDSIKGKIRALCLEKRTTTASHIAAARVRQKRANKIPEYIKQQFFSLEARV